MTSAATRIAEPVNRVRVTRSLRRLGAPFLLLLPAIVILVATIAAPLLLLALFELYRLPPDAARDALDFRRLAKLRERLLRPGLLAGVRAHRAAFDRRAQSGNAARARACAACRKGDARPTVVAHVDDVSDDVLADPGRLPVQVPVQRQRRAHQQCAAIAGDHGTGDPVADRRQRSPSSPSLLRRCGPRRPSSPS